MYHTQQQSLHASKHSIPSGEQSEAEENKWAKAKLQAAYSLCDITWKE